MRQPRWFFRGATVGVLATIVGPGLAQQSVQEPAAQSVQESEQQAVRQAVRHAEQQVEPNLIGTVALEDATVTGAASTSKDRATLAGNGTVVAKDHVAYVELARGGSVRVCATSGLHLTTGAADSMTQTPASPVLSGAPPSTPKAPLMLSLDRGALELRMNALTSDLLMTPDLRIGFSEAGALDLRVRVTRNGDTCVENRVVGLNGHPALRVASLFGDETYNVLPGQHVLFERASLREVVDNESSPCGCPEAPAVSAIEAASPSSKPGEKISSTQAEVQHPFPAAVSQGLAPAPEVPQAPPGVVHTQVSTTMTYSSADTGTAPKKDAISTAPATLPVTPPAPEKKGGLFHAIGRFFKRVF